MTQDYAGDVTPREAWELLAKDPLAVLIDVRTSAEWSYVGIPDVLALGKSLLRIEWQTYPTGALNPHFTQGVASAGVPKEAKLLLLCRSGARSAAAARLLTAEGWQTAYNIIDGFEGPPDGARHRGAVGGWKHEGLPWVQG
jgi:rhodanese-related sulfurtransferase